MRGGPGQQNICVLRRILAVNKLKYGPCPLDILERGVEMRLPLVMNPKIEQQLTHPDMLIAKPLARQNERALVVTPCLGKVARFIAHDSKGIDEADVIVGVHL